MVRLSKQMCIKTSNTISSISVFKRGRYHRFTRRNAWWWLTLHISRRALLPASDIILKSRWIIILRILIFNISKPKKWLLQNSCGWTSCSRQIIYCNEVYQRLVPKLLWSNHLIKLHSPAASRWKSYITWYTWYCRNGAILNDKRSKY